MHELMFVTLLIGASLAAIAFASLALFETGCEHIMAKQKPSWVDTEEWS